MKSRFLQVYINEKLVSYTVINDKFMIASMVKFWQKSDHDKYKLIVRYYKINLCIIFSYKHANIHIHTYIKLNT